MPTISNATGSTPGPVSDNMTELSFDFESGQFPEAPWTTGGDGDWAIDQTQVDSGSYSIKSPDLQAIYTGVPLTSNATLTLDDSFAGGLLKVRDFAR